MACAPRQRGSWMNNGAAAVEEARLGELDQAIHVDRRDRPAEGFDRQTPGGDTYLFLKPTMSSLSRRIGEV